MRDPMAHKRGRTWRAVRNSPGIQIALYFSAFVLLIAVYTYIFHQFYPVLENKPVSWVRSLLFVVESMTTVGYGDMLPFTNDLTMLLSILMMISGVIMIFMVVPLLLAPFLTTFLAPTPPRKTPHVLHGHTVIFGYDQLTHSVVDSLMIADHDIVIIEQDKATALRIATRYRRQAYVIWGDYSDPNTWAAAHITNARYIVICKDERQTASIILGIRDIVTAKIISVVDKLVFAGYLRNAGADFVLSPKQTTGVILARNAVLNLNSDDDREIPGLDRVRINLRHENEKELRLINIPVLSGCRAIAKTIRELDLFGRFSITIPFLWKSGKFVICPEADTVIDNSTSLFLFGRAESIVAAIREEFSTDGCSGASAVIAGFGDVGRGAYQELNASGISCMVVDARPQGVDQVLGNAEAEGVLKRARVEEARFCIVAVNDDDVNIFTTLTARNLNPVIRIFSRANNPASVAKLYRAGADYVALLPMIGGHTIARIVLEGYVTILLHLPDGIIVLMRHVERADPGSVGSYFRKTGVRIIGIEGPGRTVIDPGPEELLSSGDDVIAMGDTEQLKKFIHQL